MWFILTVLPARCKECTTEKLEDEEDEIKEENKEEEEEEVEEDEEEEIQYVEVKEEEKRKIHQGQNILNSQKHYTSYDSHNAT